MLTDYIGYSVTDYQLILLGRDSYTALLDDEWDQVYVGAVPGDQRELHASIFCNMYFDVALPREELSAAFSLCRPNGKYVE